MEAVCLSSLAGSICHPVDLYRVGGSWYSTEEDKVFGTVRISSHTGGGWRLGWRVSVGRRRQGLLIPRGDCEARCPRTFGFGISISTAEER